MAKPVTDEQIGDAVDAVGGLAFFSEQGKRDDPFASMKEPPVEVRQPKASTDRAKPKPEPKQAVAAKRRETSRAPSTRASTQAVEKISLPITPQMRDQLEALASELQRRRTNRSFRITRNVLMTELLRCCLKSFALSETDSANDEQELQTLVRRLTSTR